MPIIKVASNDIAIPFLSFLETSPSCDGSSSSKEYLPSFGMINLSVTTIPT